MDKEKFQQKALKQTKQKKSKSAEFLMGKDGRVAAEGIANPAFNISSTDLSAYQASEEEVIRRDKPGSTLAAHQQKLRLQAQAEPRGNECSRNYFDPPMDEEINPRQCGMEVSKEVPVKLDEKLLYDKLMTLLDEENRILVPHEKPDEDTLDSVWPAGFTKTSGLCEEGDEEETHPYIEQFEKSVQDEMILLDNFPQKQGLKHKGVFQYTEEFRRRLPKIFRSMEESRALKAAPYEGTAAKSSNLAGLNNGSNGAAGLCWEIDWSQKPQPIQIQLKCLRGVKDKVPQGSYVLKVSLRGQLGGKVLDWSKAEGQQWAGTTLPVRHHGNFYDVEICFDQSVHTEVPARKDGTPGEILLFELFLLRGTNTCIDRVVGWGAFPLCNNNLDTVDGKFKCPFLRGHYNSKIDRFQKIEQWISSDLDHWLCNLYFQIIKLPRYSDEQNKYEAALQLSSDLAYSSIAEKDRVLKKETTGGLQDNGLKSSCLPHCHSICSFASLQGRPLTSPRDSDTHKGSIPTVEKEVGKQFNGAEGWERCVSKETRTKRKDQLLKCFQQAGEATDKFKSNVKDQTEPCRKGNEPYPINSGSSDKNCDLVPVKEAHGIYSKMSQDDPSNVCGQGSPGIGLDEPAFRVTSYLEELEKHRFSVCCHPAVETRVSTSITKHLYFGVYAILSELGRGHWYSWDLWSIMLLVVLLWFARLYLHYFSQWVLLHAISVPVTKFQFYPHTVDLCYQNSLVHTSEELAMIVVGPLTLNTVMLLMVLMRWGCQLLFGSFPSYLSKLIIAWGLWTMLDPLAVFVVDAFLGRLHYAPGKPIADCAKMYWLFLRIEESGILGILITLLLYTMLFLISSTSLYLYLMRMHNEGWLLDIFKRIQSDEATLFVPFDLEISNQELSYIVKKAEQWRGINGEKRKVIVCDYIWKDHANKSGVTSTGLHLPNEILKSIGSSGAVTVHVSIYTVHLGGFQELYRHFLRLPSGAIVEAFGDISGINFIRNEGGAFVQEHISETDNALGISSENKLRERRKEYR
uniref:Orofacial cleft 1 candidate 1 (pseudo n=2 Tax=Podarcis muralis TaxID=64176 RepID=A0A670I732_PODMU